MKMLKLSREAFDKIVTHGNITKRELTHSRVYSYRSKKYKDSLESITVTELEKYEYVSSPPQKCFEGEVEFEGSVIKLDEESCSNFIKAVEMHLGIMSLPTEQSILDSLEKEKIETVEDEAKKMTEVTALLKTPEGAELLSVIANSLVKAFKQQ